MVLQKVFHCQGRCLPTAVVVVIFRNDHFTYGKGSHLQDKYKIIPSNCFTMLTRLHIYIEQDLIISQFFRQKHKHMKN